MEKINMATIEGERVMDFNELWINNSTLKSGTISSRTIQIPRDFIFQGADGNGKITIKEDGTFLVNENCVIKDIELYNEMCKIFQVQPKKVSSNV